MKFLLLLATMSVSPVVAASELGVSLKSVYDSGSTSFWGWAAYGFLKDYGVDVPEPVKDP